jgi:hypothetical protein
VAADPDADPQVVEAWLGGAVDLARVAERHDTDVAPPKARLDRQFRQGAAAKGIAVDVARTEILIAKAADRPAAAGIETS